MSADDIPIDIFDITPMEGGYFEALLVIDAARGDLARGVHQEVFASIRKDCRLFLERAAVLHPRGIDGLLDDVTEHELGFNFCMARLRDANSFQGGRLGELGDKLADIAAHFDERIEVSQLTEMELGYIEGVLGTNGSNSETAEWEGVGIEDLTQDSLRAIRRDCRAFLSKASRIYIGGGEALLDDMGANDLGYNFYLDRQGEGAGFRDRDLGDMGDRLASIAEEFGPASVELSGTVNHP